MDVKERIIVESGNLFTRFGIRSMTMDALAEQMGISKRTIYENFRDKDTLLREVIMYHKHQQTEEAHQIIDSASSAIEALFKIMKKSIQMMKQMNPNFLYDCRKYHSAIYDEVFEHSDIRDHGVTRNLLETGVKQKVFRKDINIDIVNQTLHELFNLFNPDSALTQADYHRKDLFDNIIVPYFRGISTEAGVKLLDKNKNILEK